MPQKSPNHPLIHAPIPSKNRRKSLHFQQIPVFFPIRIALRISSSDILRIKYVGQKMNPTWSSIIRVGIPFLRVLIWYRALWAITVSGAVYAPPLQKMFVVPLTEFVWAFLALTPFVILRVRSIFIAYVTIFIAALVILAYDYCISFRYISPEYTGDISSASGSYSRRFTGDDLEYWTSNPSMPDIEGIMIVLVVIAPLALAFVYRHVYSNWTKEEAQ